MKYNYKNRLLFVLINFFIKVNKKIYHPFILFMLTNKYIKIFNIYIFFLH